MSNNQEVHVQLSKKRGSKARVWHAKVISKTLDDRPREPAKRKRKEFAKNTTPAKKKKSDSGSHP